MEWINRFDEWSRVPENRSVLLLGLLFVCIILGIIYRRHREMGMSRAAKKARRRSVKDTIADKVSYAVEDLVKTRDIEREDAEAFYKRMHRIGYKDLGYEPSFGKPWYKKLPSPNASWVKGAIMARKRTAERRLALRGGVVSKLPG